MLDVNACLHYLVESGGSDLHLKVPQPAARPRSTASCVPIAGLGR